MRDAFDRAIAYVVVAYLIYAIGAIGLWLLNQVAQVIPMVAEKTR